MSSSQPVRLKSPLAEQDLLFHSLDANDELGRPFVLDVSVLSPKEDLAFDDLLGQPATIEVDLPEGGTRYFHGLISEFAQVGRQGDYAAYLMQLRPWLWFLSRTADSKIFQEKTVPDIIKEVFRDVGFTDFEDRLSGTYRTWEYCVQYRETDFNFVSRLMEQEGIYYYFRHEANKHTLVLSDASGAHEPLPGYAKIPYYPPSQNVVREEHIHDWFVRRSVQPGNYVLNAFDFRKPRADLKSANQQSRAHAHSNYEVYDYPGEYYENGEGATYATVRLQELQAQHELVRGRSDARGIFAGGLFALEEYPRDDQNREYLVVACQQSVSAIDYESGKGSELHFDCAFDAMPSGTPFRARRTTPKPVVQGPQTAIVTGPSGEEIWTDEYGRVKVQFHWDRLGGSDENSSCWVRVAQVWAGATWGAMYIPRIGQEVVVDFVEGDPDRPIVTGRVYNAVNMPPYDLPGDKTKSTIKSRSSKGGGAPNFNEIRFEDKMGEEEMYLHAEKDQTIMVENDKEETIGHDNTESVGNDESISVGKNRSKTVGVNQYESVGANKSIQVGANHTENIGANMVQTVAVAKAMTIGAAYQVSVGAAMNQTVGASKTEQVGANKSTAVAKNSSESVGKNKTIDVSDKMKISTGDDFAINGDKKGALTFADELAIKVGKAKIVIKKSGDITINGSKIVMKGSGEIVIKGSKIVEN